MSGEIKKIFAKKVGMTQVWSGDFVVPVTILQCEKESEDNLSTVQTGDVVGITGISKGKGFQGVVKRHGFGGGPKTHGQKNRLRAPGSIGATAPQRVIKGKKMAGRMGNDKVTLRNVRIVLIDEENKKILVKGAVPGMRGTRIEIKKKI